MKNKKKKHSITCECKKCLREWSKKQAEEGASDMPDFIDDYPDCPICGNNTYVDVLDMDAGTFGCVKCGTAILERIAEGGEWISDDLVERATRSMFRTERPVLGGVIEDTDAQR